MWIEEILSQTRKKKAYLAVKIKLVKCIGKFNWEGAVYRFQYGPS